jgi:dehydrogenase/reductase SDR family member 4
LPLSQLQLKGKVQLDLNLKQKIISNFPFSIGFAIAQRLGEEGASVVVSSRREKNVTKAVALLKSKNIKVHGTVCHVATAEDRAKLYAEAKEHFGGIDILVSNAAVCLIFALTVHILIAAFSGNT